MSNLNNLKEIVLSGINFSKQEAMTLWHSDYKELCSSADEIRRHFCENRFDICTIINGKSGKCTENCKFCAQSSFYHTHADEYPLIHPQSIENTHVSNSENQNQP